MGLFYVNACFHPCRQNNGRECMSESGLTEDQIRCTWYILSPPLEHTQLRPPEGHTLTPNLSPEYEVAEKKKQTNNIYILTITWYPFTTCKQRLRQRSGVTTLRWGQEPESRLLRICSHFNSNAWMVETMPSLQPHIDAHTYRQLKQQPAVPVRCLLWDLDGLAQERFCRVHQILKMNITVNNQ